MVTDNHYRWDFIGLSTDQKPTPATSEKVVDGSTFYCSDNSKLYVFCKDTWYERKALGGGSDITVVQTTGNSTTSVMSQNAVTEALANAGAAVFYADKANFTTAADTITLYFDDSLDTAATTAQVHAVVSSGKPVTVITRNALEDDERSTFNLVDSQYPKFCTDSTMDDYGMYLNFIDIVLGKIIKLSSNAMPNDDSNFTAFITNL